MLPSCSKTFNKGRRVYRFMPPKSTGCRRLAEVREDYVGTVGTSDSARSRI